MGVRNFSQLSWIERVSNFWDIWEGKSKIIIKVVKLPCCTQVYERLIAYILLNI